MSSLKGITSIVS